jgi:hypothetical protein
MGPCNPAGIAMEALWRESAMVESAFMIKKSANAASALLQEHENEPYTLEYGPIIPTA